MIEINVCVGSSCHLKGSHAVINEIKRLIALEKLENKIILKASFCTGDCTNGVCIKINDEKIKNVTPQKIKDIFYDKIML